MKPVIPALARRQPVWLILAELYLDTELQEADFQRSAAVLAASGFNWAEIRQINYNEVAPLLWQNLLSMAGEWAGWDENSLLPALTARYIGTPQRLLESRNLWQRVIDYFTAEWLAKIAAYLS